MGRGVTEPYSAVAARCGAAQVRREPYSTARFDVGATWDARALLRGVARYDVAQVRREPHFAVPFDVA